MHGQPDPQFYLRISGFLGTFYLLIAIMNAIVAYRWWSGGKDIAFLKLGKISITGSVLWLAYSIGVVICAALAYSGDGNWMQVISLPEVVRARINTAMNPTAYTLISVGLLVVMYLFRSFFVQPTVAYILFNASLMLFGLSMTDVNFAEIVTKADNVPIVGLIYLLAFFTWLATFQAVQNDERRRQGLEPMEKMADEKVLVWPDLVYTELICMVALTAFLIAWAVLLPAPLEEPASAVKTPNPSKAPWYFLGLQELLVYYDPWMAGVALPGTVVVGLMAIPYLDFNKKGNGYYTIEERQFAYLTFQFGFFVLWITLIVMGTFLRGPNWNFFGPYEYWDPHKVEVLNNTNLSEFFWVDFMGLFGILRPKAPEGSGELVKFGYALGREAPGIVLLIGYFAVLPAVLPMYVGFFRELFLKMGLIRYMVLANLLLLMALVPLKMIGRWTVNLKYFVDLSEYLLNF